MEILDKITKQVFEAFVPAAKMPEHNDSVYGRLSEQFKVVYDRLIQNVVAPSLETELDAEGPLQKEVLRYVCLEAFVQSIRSLDLVLTATGFGIVSTASMAPASKSRVDALMEDCRLRAAESLCQIIHCMTIRTGWDDTPQARQSIQCLFWHISSLREYTTLPYTADNWQKARGLSITADAFLRKAISEEYMEDLLRKMRSATLDNADIIIVQKCNSFTGGFISSYEFEKGPNQNRLDDIVEQLEAYPASYPVYTASETYKARHGERYRNRKEDPTFFFM